MLAALVIGLLPGSLQAQGTATITGVVKDSSEAPLPGVTVKIVSEASGTAVDAVTDGQGAYSASVAPGPYRLEAALDGFETAVRQVVVGAGSSTSADLTLSPARFTEGVVVTARRVEEVVQEVPIPVSVVERRARRERRRLQRKPREGADPDRAVLLVQSAQLVGRRSAGSGAPFGLTNDGIEPGVGLYIDGVFYARPAAATLDFLDVERVEVLRGPQGTLFGKNTTAGAINVTTPPAELHAREQRRARATAATASSRRRRRSPARCSRRLPGGCRSRARGRDGIVYNTTTAEQDSTR